jgi:hypothetical protein
MRGGGGVNHKRFILEESTLKAAHVFGMGTILAAAWAGHVQGAVDCGATTRFRDPVYALIWLPDLPSGDSVNPQGLNELSEVVGSAKDEAGRERAFLWLPRENHSGVNGDPLAAETLHDLGTLDGSNADTSRAFDINEAGFIVGESIVGSTRFGLYWEPDVAAAVNAASRKQTISYPDSPTATPSGSFGTADAINDESTPVVAA